jgi:diguanylate cyclase (GGDEF)-like protein/PAS domain S-box-containing protein
LRLVGRTVLHKLLRGGDPRADETSQPDDRFTTLAETSPAAVLMARDGAISYANQAATDLTGYSIRELLGRPIVSLIHPDFEALFTQRERVRHRSSLATARYELKVLTQSQDERWADVVVTTTQQGNVLSTLWMCIDINDRKLAEHALREAERRMRDILENVRLVAVMRDVHGDVTFANEFVVELLGCTEEDVVGVNWFDAFVAAEHREGLRDAYADTLALGSVSPHDESEVVTRLGERRMISWNHTLLHDVDGVIIGTASIGSDVTERRRFEQQLLHDAFHDALTGLPNRALFLDRLGSALARLKRHPDRLLAVLFLDLDRFKLINDSLGHSVGDELLVAISRVVREAIRPGDTVARLGGDEFTVLLEDLEDPTEASTVAQRILAAMNVPFVISGHEVFATGSVGIALSSRHYEMPEDMLRDADTAMYRAKSEGKARHRVFDTSMHTQALELLALENDLRRAVDGKRFVVHYQPIVELATGVIVGVEALVRWDHSQRGLIGPSEFIHLAEETGLVIGISDQVLWQACRDAHTWETKFPFPVSVNVNLSTRAFSQADLVERVASVLAQTKLSAARLKLEITESALMENPDTTAAMLHRFRELGARICIDDFGTGYSSLSYLLRFPVDTLKIDRSFVAAIGRGQRNAQLVGTMVALARSLGMDVVAEGVETEEQRRYLLDLGCAHAQGYLFSRPLILAELEVLLSMSRVPTASPQEQ